MEKNTRTDELYAPNSKKKESMMGPLLVPQRLRSNAFVKGRLPVVIAETNEAEYREEDYEINLKKKKITKERFNCRTKLKKVTNKRV